MKMMADAIGRIDESHGVYANEHSFANCETRLARNNRTPTGSLRFSVSVGLGRKLSMLGSRQERLCGLGVVECRVRSAVFPACRAHNLFFSIAPLP